VPESVPGVPESVPGVPESVPGVPESVPGVPESVPGVPVSLPTEPESVGVVVLLQPTATKAKAIIPTIVFCRSILLVSIVADSRKAVFDEEARASGTPVPRRKSARTDPARSVS
jgi:hypothetical protein